MSKMNDFYALAVKDAVSIDKKAGSMYGNIGQFVVATCYVDGVPPAEGTDIKPLFKAQEKFATIESKVAMEKNSSYRVIKGLLVKCVAMQVPLLDEKGNLRGKSELEAEVKALSEDKTELDKFKHTISTLTKINDKLTQAERLIAAGLVNDLLNSMTAELKVAA